MTKYTKLLERRKCMKNEKQIIIKASLEFVAVLVVLFYLLPLLFKGSIGLLIVVNPIVIIMCSYLISKKYNFCLRNIALVAILYLPSMYVFYNDSAWIYVVIYVVFALIGNYIGHKKYNKSK